MRSELELLSDISSLTANEWNLKLADEFGFEFVPFVQAVNQYSYIQPSEDAIHRQVTKPVDIVFKNNEAAINLNKMNQGLEIVKTSNIGEIQGIISTANRKIEAFDFGYNSAVKGLIYFGFEFNMCHLSSTSIEGCVFNNCIFNECVLDFTLLTTSKFIDCEFLKCDLDSIVMYKTGLHGCNFNSCDLSNAIFSDVAMHATAFVGCEMEGSQHIGGGYHRTGIVNSTMNRSSILNTLLSVCDFSNSSIKKSRIISCHIIGTLFSACHMDGSVQHSNMTLDLKLSTDLINFFEESAVYEDDESEEDGDSDSNHPDFTPPTLDDVLGLGDDDEC